jgi:hypothetical protein
MVGRQFSSDFSYHMEYKSLWHDFHFLGNSNSDKGKSLLPSSNNKQQKVLGQDPSQLFLVSPMTKRLLNPNPIIPFTTMITHLRDPSHIIFSHIIFRYDNNKASTVPRSQNSLRTVKFRNNGRLSYW